MSYAVYSLADTRTVLYHPNVGQANLHLCGRGKMVISYSGDQSSHTTTADGYVVVNKLKSDNGIITLEVPQNSIADDFLSKFEQYLRNCSDTSRFLLGTLTVYDTAGHRTITMSGVTVQKAPDRTYDRSSTNLTYTLLAASITEQYT